MRRALPFVLVGALFVLMPVVFWVVLRLSVDTTPIDCSRPAPAPGAWQAADHLGKAELVTQIEGCRLLDGADRTRVQQLLGPPEGSNPYEGGPPQPNGSQWSWAYGPPSFENEQIFVVSFAGDLVKDTFTTPGPD